MKTPVPWEDRWLLDRETGCLNYTMARDRNGYGVAMIGGKYQKAHRVAWERANGPIPDGLCILHRCDNPPCGNLDHLFLGTNEENTEDRDRKGRGRAPKGERCGAAKLDAKSVRLIRYLWAAQKMSITTLAKEFGVTYGAIWLIIKRKNWRSL